jgi:ariadne-1
MEWQHLPLKCELSARNEVKSVTNTSGRRLATPREGAFALHKREVFGNGVTESQTVLKSRPGLLHFLFFSPPLPLSLQAAFASLVQSPSFLGVCGVVSGWALRRRQHHHQSINGDRLSGTKRLLRFNSIQRVNKINSAPLSCLSLPYITPSSGFFSMSSIMDEDDVALSDFEDYVSDDDLDMQASISSDSPADELVDDADAAYNDDDLNFSQDLEKIRRKPWEVDYRVLDVQDIVNAQVKEVEQIAVMFAIKNTDAAILLRHFGWNKERLIERYMDAPEKVNREAGVHEDPSHPRMQALSDFTCDICFTSADDMPVPPPKDKAKGKKAAPPTLNTLAMACNHRFCVDCYRTYLEQKIRIDGESRRIQCMEEKCNIVVDEHTVEMVVSPALVERYKILLNRTYVDDANNLRWCPAPNCEFAIECNIAGSASRERNLAKRRRRDGPRSHLVPTVQCQCGHAFCFGCGNEGHAPAVCDVVRMWIRKCEDDSETANWISANTKECPQCNSTIEKNGGCNHMTCRKCRYEWCWICAGPWSQHGNSWYNCNRYDEKSGADARDQQAKSRASLERYLHYFNRFANHEQSARLDRDLYKRTELKMEEMQQKSELTWIEVQFLKKAVDTVTECRMTLKWTYAMAYYLARNNMTELFEDNQRDLERAVEDLSEQLEKPIEKDVIANLRQVVTDLTVYVQRRREIMLSDTAEGFAEGRWSWNTDF